MTAKDGLSIRLFADTAGWDQWLTEHGAHEPGLWLQFAKKGGGGASLAKAEAIEVALIHGWIDGQLGRWDEQYSLTRFTPRRRGSRWSAVNRDTAERLIAADRIRPAGLAAVAEAKANGNWDIAYAPASRSVVPDDLAAALAAEPAAAAFFASLTGANRYAVLYRIGEAKTGATRAARIAKFVAMLARGETLH